MHSMHQKTKELWAIPIFIALVTGIPLGAGFMFLGLWVSGTPIHPSFSIEWLWRALSAPLPVWITLAVLLVGAIVAGLLFRQLARTAEEIAQKNSAAQSLRSAQSQIAKLNEAHAAEIEKLNSKEPRLHGVWNNMQTFWGMGRHGETPMMQIGGWIDLTSSNTKDTLHLLAAYIGDQRSQIFIGVGVEPGLVNRKQVVLYMVPPLTTDTTKPFTATIVVEDQFNRKYLLPTQEFRATSRSLTPLPAKAEELRQPDAPSDALAAGELIIKAPDDLAMRISHYQFQETRGLTLTVDNNRLNPIHQIRVIVAEAQSFDARHNTYRQGSNFSAAVVTAPNEIEPSCSGNPVLLIRKEASNNSLLAGNDFSHAMVWAQNDTSEVQRWRFTLRVMASTFPRNASEKSLPLKELSANIVVLWDGAKNQFSVERENE